MALPDVTVECSFTGSDDSPAWVDITDFVQNISTSRGRNREVDQFDAGTASLVLINNDRRFDPEYSSGPYYGALKPNRPIRIIAAFGAGGGGGPSIGFDEPGVGFDEPGIGFDETGGGGGAPEYPIFRGYVDNWPQAYDYPNVSRVGISCTDAFKRLERMQLADSAYASTILEQAPDHWYRFNETSGFRAHDSVGRVNGKYEEMTLGLDGLLVGDTNKAISNNTATEERVVIKKIDLIPNYPFSFSAVISTVSNRSEFKTIFYGATGTGSYDGWITCGIANTASTYGSAGAVVFTTHPEDPTEGTGPPVGAPLVISSGSTKVDDGEPHHIGIVCAATNDYKVYVDGVDRTSVTSGGTSLRGLPRVAIGWAWANRSKDSFGAYSLHGTIDEGAIWSTRALSAQEMADQAAAVLGYENELSGDRVDRLLDAVGWSATLRDIDSGKTPLQAQALNEGTTALAALRTVDLTEGGGLFVSREGDVTFRSRWGPLTDERAITSQATFGDTTNELPYADIAFAFDDELLRNYITGQRVNGSTVYVMSTSSIETYGYGAYQRTQTLEVDDDTVEYACEFELQNHKDVQTRISTLRVNGQSNENGMDEDDLFPVLLDLEIGDRITVNRRPQSVGSVISKDLIIEGVGHDITPDSWVTQYQVSPPPAYVGAYLILNDATYGLLNTGRLGY